MRTLIICLSISFSTVTVFGQDVDSLNNRVSELNEQIKVLKEELKQTEDLFPPSYGWKKGFATTIGLNASSMNNWVVNANPNSRATTILGSFSGYTNLIEEKYFWRNSAIINMGWQRLQNDIDSDEDSEFQPTVDVFQIASLLGWNLTKTVALSAMSELRTTLIRNSFDPGYIDLGIGFTWTPIPNLVAVVHPLNYNLIIAKDDTMYESSLGTKYIVDYAQEVYKGVKLRSNLNGFASYTDLGNMSNTTWTTGISFTTFKGIGVGFEYALRWSPQETADVDSDLQRYFLIGLSYSL